MGDKRTGGFSETQLKFTDGLIPAIVQDAVTGKVLMLAYMSKESLRITLEEGRTCFYSRSRQTLWRKGETSGDVQRVISISADCDGDALLVKVDTDGRPACHTGSASCFDVGPSTTVGDLPEDGSKARSARPDAHPGTPATAAAAESTLSQLYGVVAGRKACPVEGSYTTYLFTKGQDKILKKVGEECAEVIIASKNRSEAELVYEMADLFYHCMVLLADHGIPPERVMAELESRRK